MDLDSSMEKQMHQEVNVTFEPVDGVCNPSGNNVDSTQLS